MTEHPARAALIETLEDPVGGLQNYVLRGASLTDANQSRFDLEEDLAEAVVADVLRAAEALVRRQFVAYDPSYQTSTSQVLVENLSDVPELAAVDLNIRLGNAPDDAGGDPVLAMAHVVGTGKGQIVAYRMKGAGIATRRSRGITLVPRDGVYRQLKGDILFYEPKFDAYTLAGFVFFQSASLIQSKLNAPAKARKLAKEALAAATAKVEIDGFDELEKAVMDDSNLRAKMAHIARVLRDDPDYARVLTTERLVAFVENHNPDIPLAVRNGKTILSFDPSPQHRHQIPRLLADDYLHSFLTDRKYEAGSKQPVAD